MRTTNGADILSMLAGIQPLFQHVKQQLENDMLYPVMDGQPIFRQLEWMEYNTSTLIPP